MVASTRNDYFERKLRSESRPISRVLSWVIIHLQYRSPCTSSDLPEPNCGPQYAGSYLVLLQVGFSLPHCVATGAVRSYRTISPLPNHSTWSGGIFSAALSVGSRPPGVTWHPALWSPDFPPPPSFKGN